MELKNMNLEQASSELDQAFLSQENVILYIGSDYQGRRLPEIITNQPWGGVITSLEMDEYGRRIAFGSEFNKKELKKIKMIDELDRIKSIIYSKQEVPIVFLWGSYKKFETDELELPIYLEKLAKKLTPRSRILVAGYNSDNENELPIKLLRLFLKKSSEKGVKTIVFGNIEKEEVIKDYCNAWCSEKLENVLSEVGVADEDIPELKSLEEYRTFYVDNNAKKIQRNDIQEESTSYELLTAENIYDITLQGSVSLEEGFSSFIDKSFEGPQWYGYRENTEFYVKRDYEDSLLKLLRSLLWRIKPYYTNSFTPVIIKGASCSSKSIELAAIAYRIFDEKKHPVIYIKKEYQEETDDKALNDLMKNVERAGGDNTTILVLWDSSSFDDMKSKANNLYKKLNDYGRRRFVMVCTSLYQGTSNDNEKEVEGLGREFTFTENCYYVLSKRQLSEREIESFYGKIRKYSSIDFEESADQKDVFNLFFRLSTKLRPKLKRGFRKESQYVKQYISSLLSKEEEEKERLDRKKEFENNVFIKAWNEKNPDNTISLEEKETYDNTFDLDSFFGCIALMSKYNLRTPYELAFYMLMRDKEKKSNYALYDILANETQITVFCNDDTDGDYFLFRSSAEAQFFLEKKEYDADKIVDTVCSVIDYYIKSVEDDDSSFLLEDQLKKLLQLIGPNSRYYKNRADCSEDGGAREFEDLWYRIPKIIDKITNLLRSEELDRNYDFTLLWVTFTREYNGHTYDEKHNPHKEQKDKQSRLSALKKARQKSLDCAKAVEDNKLKNRFLVEWCSCDNDIGKVCADDENLKKEYQRVEYKDIYNRLDAAISSALQKNYLYNTLFRRFLDEYSTSSDDVYKARILLNIMQHVDNACNDIEDSSKEHTELITKILEDAKKYSITIQQLKRLMREGVQSKEDELFKKLLDNDPCSIMYFACRRELTDAGLEYIVRRDRTEEKKKYNEINNKQKETCRKIIDFLEDDIIAQNTSVLLLKVKVVWLYYNGTCFDAFEQHKCTKISEDGWIRLSSICQTIIDNYNNDPNRKRPEAYYIKGLADIALNPDDASVYSKARRTLQEFPQDSLGNNFRQKTPYYICDSLGKRISRSGVIKNYDVDKRQGMIQIEIGGRPLDVHINSKSLYNRQTDLKDVLVKDVKLGLGFYGLIAFIDGEEKKQK